MAFFGLLQEKGRLVDFLMEDVTAYEDAEVGAAARVIHQGCRQVLEEYFKISAISQAQEGAEVTVPTGYSPISTDWSENSLESLHSPERSFTRVGKPNLSSSSNRGDRSPPSDCPR